MSATLLVERKKFFVACVRNLNIIVDGQEVGVVANGKTSSFPISAGDHVIAVQMGAASCRPLTITASEGETTKVNAALKMGWWTTSDFVLTREDGSGADGSSPPAKHHGKIILIFGILGFLVGILGLAAMGQGIVDLKKMGRGEMDPSGKNLTLAGTIIGGIAFALGVLGLISKYLLGG